MILFYTNNKDQYSRDFIEALPNKMELKFLEFVDIKKLTPFLKNYELNNAKLTELDLIDICKKALKTSIIIESNDSYTILIDPTYRVKLLKVDNIIKLINDGNLVILPYPIFTRIKDFIIKLLDLLYSTYNMGIMI